MSLNGHRIAADALTPDFTDYRKRFAYQTYDVTALIARGPNTLGAIFGDGWYASPLLWSGIHAFGTTPRLLAQLELLYADGTHSTIATAPDWTSSPSAITSSTIYASEAYDARLEQPNWDTPSFNAAHWTAAAVSAAPEAAITAQLGSPVHAALHLTPKSFKTLANGDVVFDLGQNMVGWATEAANLERGHRGQRESPYRTVGRGTQRRSNRLPHGNGQVPQLQLWKRLGDRTAEAERNPRCRNVCVEPGRPEGQQGEKGIRILAPMTGVRRKKDDAAAKDIRTQNQSVLVGFRSVYVFDVSQTEGAELPELSSRVTGDVGERRERLLGFIAGQGILLEYKESIAPALGMSYGGRIVLLPGQSPAEDFSTLVHETAHELLHKTSRRSGIRRSMTFAHRTVRCRASATG